MLSETSIAFIHTLQLLFCSYVVLQQWFTWHGLQGTSAKPFSLPKGILVLLRPRLQRKLYWAGLWNQYPQQNHRIIGWKRPLRSSSPTIRPTTLCLLNHIPKCHTYMFFKHFQSWRLHHLPGQRIPMSDHSVNKEIFPNIQSKPPLMQLEAISYHPIAS